jgi:hypothetical protein
MANNSQPISEQVHRIEPRGQVGPHTHCRATILDHAKEIEKDSSTAAALLSSRFPCRTFPRSGIYREREKKRLSSNKKLSGLAVYDNLSNESPQLLSKADVLQNFKCSHPTRVPHVINLSAFKNCLTVDDCAKGLFVRGKTGARTNIKKLLCVKLPQADANTISTLKWDQFRSVMKSCLSKKKDIGRGESRGSSCDRYICFGYRKDPRGSTVGKYAYKRNVPSAEASGHDKEVSEMVGLMETLCAKYIPLQDLETYEDAVCGANKVPKLSATESGLCTQFSVGTNYHSLQHTDDDFFYTMISCLHPASSSSPRRGQVLQYFVFPEYDVAIPMCSGDILVFNPRVVHGCTQPLIAGSFIFSAYTSAKTVLTSAAAEHLHP